MPRPPTLREKVLKVIGTRGPLSKKMIEKITGHHGADISRAVDFLKKSGMISGPFRIAPSIGKPPRKGNLGRPHLVYIVSFNGMNDILSTSSASEFWKMLSTISYYRKEKVDQAAVNKTYESYLKINLGYSSMYLSDFRLDYVNLYCEKWYERVCKPGMNGPIIEKILKVLAINRSLTVDEISKLISESVSETEEAVGILSYVQDTSFKNHDGITTDLPFFQSIEVAPLKFGGEQYRLTLVGILLVLFIIHKRAKETKHPNLIDSKYTIDEFYMKIAESYNDKLSLIFGKWLKLRHNLAIMSILNLDIILDKKFRHDSLTSSGNATIYNSLRSIFTDSRAFLTDLQSSGFFEMMNIVGANYLKIDLDYEKARKIIWKRLLPVYELWLKLTLVVTEKVYDYKFIKQKLSKDEDLETGGLAESIRTYSMKTTEKSLENEITTLYYMNLNDPYKFNIMPSNYSLNNVKRIQNSIEASPLHKLSSLLHDDRRIRDHLENMLQDVINYNMRLATSIEVIKSSLAVL
jgi:hypothetical protein